MSNYIALGIMVVSALVIWATKLLDGKGPEAGCLGVMISAVAGILFLIGLGGVLL